MSDLGQCFGGLDIVLGDEAVKVRCQLAIIHSGPCEFWHGNVRITAQLAPAKRHSAVVRFEEEKPPTPR